MANDGMIPLEMDKYCYFVVLFILFTAASVSLLKHVYRGESDNTKSYNNISIENVNPKMVLQ